MKKIWRKHIQIILIMFTFAIVVPVIMTSCGTDDEEIVDDDDGDDDDDGEEPGGGNGNGNGNGGGSGGNNITLDQIVYSPVTHENYRKPDREEFSVLNRKIVKGEYDEDQVEYELKFNQLFNMFNPVGVKTHSVVYTTDFEPYEDISNSSIFDSRDDLKIDFKRLDISDLYRYEIFDQNIGDSLYTEYSRKEVSVVTTRANLTFKFNLDVEAPAKFITPSGNTITVHQQMDNFITDIKLKDNKIVSTTIISENLTETVELKAIIQYKLLGEARERTSTWQVTWYDPSHPNHPSNH